MKKSELLKIRTQKWILACSVLILAGKFAAYFITNSAGIYTDALESIVNVIAGAISLFSLVWGAKPKDKDHPFGHGKIELISASAEGLMITAAGVIIIIEGVRRLLIPAPISGLDTGIVIVAVSGLANWIMGTVSVRLGKRHDSAALVASGRHLQSDTYSTIGLVSGLLVVMFTEIYWIDSLLALIFGVIIIVTGVSILKKSIDNLLDKADEALLSEMVSVIESNRQDEWVDIHNARLTKYGSMLHLDCDLTVPWYLNIEQGHDLGQKLEQLLDSRYGDRLNLTLHLDPCNIRENTICSHCRVAGCSERRQPYTGTIPLYRPNCMS